MMGSIKGMFYNRCSRIHELLAITLEDKLYNRFLVDTPEEEIHEIQYLMSSVPSDPSSVEKYLDTPAIHRHLQVYEEFFQAVLKGSLGATAQYWAIYIFLINRLHRELQRCVKTNDVSGYLQVLPAVLEVFFALNRPNYARWGSLFFQKLKSADSCLMEILEQGAFSIRRTNKSYSRSAVDLSLEQTVNRDAASRMTGIVAFRNSENAMRRWSLTMTQRALAVTELRAMTGLEQGETPTSQCRSSRIKRDNRQINLLSVKLDEFCNPFSEDSPGALINVATGQEATQATADYLLNTLERGKSQRQKFQDEWEGNSGRFLQPIKRCIINNFAAQNVTKKKKMYVA